MEFNPEIDEAVWALAPGFRALSIIARRNDVAVQDAISAAAALARALADVPHGPSWADTHLLAWAEVFRRFGAKPQRTPCSAASIRERVLKTGVLGTINPVVDLYNAVSLRFAVPVGGENIAAYAGNARLVVANGSEHFDTMKNGEPVMENPERGEVVWRDDVGVTCRRWNWRQGVRTRLDAASTDMWFVLESLPEMPVDALHEAGNALVDGLKTLFGDVSVSIKLISGR